MVFAWSREDVMQPRGLHRTSLTITVRTEAVLSHELFAAALESHESTSLITLTEAAVAAV